MKHTDVLLGIRPPVDPTIDRQTQQSLAEIKHKFTLVNELSKAEGWLFFQQELVNEERRLLAMIERTESPTHLAKLNGTLLAVKSFATWPEYIAAELDAQAKNLATDD